MATAASSSPSATARGPRGTLLLGNLRAYLHDPLGYMVEMPRQYGPVVRLRLLQTPYYVVAHPDGVQRILHDNARNYLRAPQVIDPVKVSFGAGLLVTEGAPYLRHRRMMQPIFHHRHVQTFAELMAHQTAALLTAWEAPAQRGERVDVAAAMKRLALAIVTRALFSADLDRTADAQVLSAANDTLNDAAFRRAMYYPVYPPPAVPTPHNRRFRAAARHLDHLVYRLIAVRRAQYDTQSDNAASDSATDLLSLLIEARDAETGEGMTDRQIRDEALNLIFAGHDTVANALTWTLYLLARHPDVVERLEAEVATELGGRAPTVGDLARLPYSRMILDEALRLYPPVPIDPRRALSADTICGYHIPARANVSVGIYAVHHHPDYWPRPTDFDPERFTPAAVASRHRYAYLPFFAGQHLCMGKDFALLEAQLALIMVAQRYRLTLAPGQVVEPHLGLTLSPRGGLPMTLHSRA
jgi:cytochrome P450